MDKSADNTRKIEGLELEECTHHMRSNNLNVFAMHSQDGLPVSREDQKKILDGPIMAVQDDLAEEYKKPSMIPSKG